MTELNERQRTIVERIRSSGQQSINDLSEVFGVATQTIRRDINELCDRGLARRVHGGVSPPMNPVNLNFQSRRILNEDAKRAIGRATAALIPDGATVLLGIGTTVQYTAQALTEKAGLSIVTNNLEVATLLCSASDMQVRVVEGALRPEDRDLTGPSALRGFAGFLADFCIVGAGALDREFGILDFKRFDAEVGDTILTHARTRILVADHSKWGKSASHRVSDWSRIDHLVTDQLTAMSADTWRDLHPDVALTLAASSTAS